MSEKSNAAYRKREPWDEQRIVITLYEADFDLTEDFIAALSDKADDALKSKDWEALDHCVSLIHDLADAMDEAKEAADEVDNQPGE